MNATSADEVPAHIRLCLEHGPIVLHALECFIGAYEAAGEAAKRVAAGDDAVFEALMAKIGAWELGEMLGVMRDRCTTALGGTGGEVAADEAAGLVATAAGWHAPPRRRRTPDGRFAPEG